MTTIDMTERERRRILAVNLAIFAALGLLALVLWHMQLGRGNSYLDSQESQSLRRVRLPAVRGQILDRNGLCLAENRPDYGICIYLEELRRTDKKRRTAQKAWELVQDISLALGIAPQTSQKQINAHLAVRKPLPMPAWRHVDFAVMARFAELGSRFPAADIMLDSRRVYPQGKLAAHIIGYAGESDSAQADEMEYHYYLPDMEGKTGLEKHYNKWLAGNAGGSLVRIDVTGYKHGETGLRESVPGGDLRLGLDARIQRIAEQVIADTCGAAVVVDPDTGDVLAMASSPAFDPNIFCTRLSPADWRALADDWRKPLFNRAITGAYPPGSTFKPIIALAALLQGKAAENTAMVCDGVFELGGQAFSCPGAKGHGEVDIRRALEVSCNVFFFRLGLKCGYDAIYHTALAAGFGEQTGLDIGGESAGFLPSKAWKRQVRGEAWTDGDTCNISVGQGSLAATPLQMAMFAAALANGGKLYRPRLVTGRRPHGQEAFDEIAPRLERDLLWSDPRAAAVREGMRQVVCGGDGTGRLAALPDVAMAGKTGTAEFGRKGSGQQHGWMIVFAPYEKPRYAAAVIVDEAVSGGATVAPRVRRMMAEIFALERQEG